MENSPSSRLASKSADFNLTQIGAADRYRLLTKLIGPRPIALASTRSVDGQSNAAPISFFNVFSHDRAIVWTPRAGM